MNKLKPHKLCSHIAEIGSDDYARLLKDIRENGLRDPITVYKDEIIDGRARYRACLELGLKPATKEWDGKGSILSYIRSRNLIRRHLTKSQIAVALLNLLPEYQKRARKNQAHGSTAPGKTLSDSSREALEKEWRGKATTLLGQDYKISGRLIERASTVQEKAPHLIPEIEGRKLTVGQAERITKERDRQERARLGAESFRGIDDIDIRHGDMRKLIKDMPENSIDLILTDPLYALEHLADNDDLGKEAARVLKKGGFILIYSGNYNLAMVVEILNRYLTPQWDFSIVNNSSQKCKRYINQHRPVLIYSKGKARTDLKSFVPDVIYSFEKEKDWGEYQQPLDPVEELIEDFSLEGETVLDPFTGTGTTAVACLRTKRRFIGFEKEKGEVNKVKARLAEEVEKQRYNLIFKPTPEIQLMDAMEFLDSIPNNSVDLLITDPPYSKGSDPDSPALRDITAFVESWFLKALRTVKRAGRAFIFIGGYPKEKEAYYHAINNQDILKVGSDLVWTYKNVLGNPANAPVDYRRNHQTILYLYGPDAPPLNTEKLMELLTVQEFHTRRPTYSPWEKPRALAEMLIRHCTIPNDSIIDPFAGTGTFTLAGCGLGRRVYAVDNSQEMLEKAEKRGCTIKRRGSMNSLAGRFRDMCPVDVDLQPDWFSLDAVKEWDAILGGLE